ncbi:homeobox protein NANOG-like [Lissotriton helveticus]
MASPDAPLSAAHRPRLTLSSHMAIPPSLPKGPFTRFYWVPEGQDPFNSGGPPEKGDPVPDCPSSSPDSGIDLSPSDPACPKLEFSFPPGVDVGKPIEKSKGRVAFSKEQLLIMQERFQRQKYLSPLQIQELATSLGLTYKQVKTWFQNRRMKIKKLNKEATFKNENSMLQCDLPSSTCSEPSPGFYPGYSIHARKSTVGPMVNQLQNYGHPNAPYTIMQEESAPWWNSVGVQHNPGSHFNKPHQVEPAVPQEIDFWQNVMMMDGMSQESGYSFPPHWNFPGASGLFYPGNKLLQNYPQPLQKYPPAHNYPPLNYPHLERAPTDWDDSEEL